MQQIAEEASSDVKVILTRAGSDGIFLSDAEGFLKIKNDSDIPNDNQFLTNKDARKFFNWSNEKEHIAKVSRIKFLSNCNKSTKAKVQMLGFNFKASHYYEILDLCFMKYGVQARIPFLKQSFVKKMLGISHKKLIGDPGWYSNYRGKLILKNLVKQDFGEEFAFRQKIGYTIPCYIWMYSDFCYNLIVSIIKSSDIVNQNIKKIHLDDICKQTGVYNTDYYFKLFWSILNLKSLEV